ncbi:hypothetical protein OEZ86_003603 [Tetradesmus obliquus]|nr:hypothetical protein OEZ86_003603 [Tetradesmus obliquus]
MKVKATKRKAEAADSLHGDGHSIKVSKINAAAAGVASAHHAAAAASPPAASKAARQLLALQIEAKEKAVKLMKKLAARNDPAKKAVLQQKLDKLLSKAAPPSAAAVAAAAPGGGIGSAAAAAGTASAVPAMRKHRPQPLAGITSVLANTPAEQARRAERQQRFAADLAAMKQPGGSSSSSAQQQQDEGIGAAGGWLALGGGYGSSRSLEKEYLRLTSVPKAEDVRPPEVLAQSLALIKRRWRGGCSYAWACSQLKSVRQDLTVQGVADGLAVDAYETHARVALESNDLPEFRQCLARLKQLYRAGVPGCAPEFYSYAVLHAAALGPLLLNQELGQLPRHHLEHPAIVHALATARAVRSGAYVSFMRLYASAPRMAPYLMDALLPRVRGQGLAALLAAHRPARLPLGWALLQLGWEEDQEGEALRYLAQHGVVVDEAAREIDTRASLAAAAASRS